MLKSMLFFAVAFSFAACNNQQTKEPSETAQPANAVESTATAEELLNKEWKLVKLNGSGIALDTSFPNYPHLKFTNLVSTGGNLGCNGFGANVHISAADSIKISEIISTQMACPNLDIETQFMKALGNARTYKITGDTLALNDDKRETIALFKKQ